MTQTASEFAIKVVILSVVVSLLPASPFVGFSTLINQVPFISYLNWFLPIPEMITIMESWLAVVAVYYTILFGLNYVGILKS